MHEEICYLGWKEKVIGADGVAKVIIIPFDDETRERIERVMDKLKELLDLTTFSEETIQFKILELDR